MTDKRSITSALNLAKARAAKTVKKQAVEKDQLVAEFNLTPVGAGGAVGGEAPIERSNDLQAHLETLKQQQERLDKLYELVETDRKERAERRAQRQKEKEQPVTQPEPELKPVPLQRGNYADLFGY